ncbi:MAG: ABC transporter permease [Tannerella sp.]|jgi:putative ABC transport system permease protein|nr:ABC transporter permease [Tannerella sp.]
MMRQLYYAFKAIANARGNNVIKIISLSLGLLVGLLLFSRVGYEASFDNFYRDVDRLFLIKNRYTIGGKDAGSSHIVMAPMAPALNDEFPEVVSASTVYANKGKEPFFLDDRKYELKPLIADSLFFKTAGIEVLSGDDRLLGVQDNIFISERTAKLIFGDGDPVGRTLMYMQNYPYTVQGVFEDVPDNNSLRGDAVISFANVGKQFGLGAGWDGGDSFWGIVRLAAGANPDFINREINGVWRKYFDYDRMAQDGFAINSFLAPFRGIHSDTGTVSMSILMSALALIILLIATLNYVLISISSLVKRSKEVSIHKCNGASTASIFGMFLYETALLVLVSLAATALAIFVFRTQIETLIDVRLEAIFTLSNLWVSAAVVLFLFLMSGFLPARIFSVIPVTQIFRTFTNNRKLWKQILLFMQFLGISFVTLLLIVAFRQYGLLINKDLGYVADNVVYLRMNGVKGATGEETGRNIGLLRQELERFPFVESAATSASIPIAYGGAPIADDDGAVLFSSRYETCDADYIRTMGMEFASGGNFTASGEGDAGEVIVTENFVKRMGWTDNPVGREVKSYGKIVGVLRDYVSSPLYGGYGYEPVLIRGRRFCTQILTLRLTATTPENLKAIDDRLGRLYPDDDMGLSILKDRLDSDYEPVRNFRNITLAACVCIFLITLMGLAGYVNDEIQRRRKEIAIRKINGATRGNILRIVASGIASMALPAIAIACAGAYFAGERLLQLFTERTAMDLTVFGGGSAAVLLVITAVAIVMSWQIAGENPSKTVNCE